jgi:hypothetical protein
MNTLLIPISRREAQIINGVITVTAIGGAFLFKNNIHKVYEFVINYFIETNKTKDSLEKKPQEKSENTNRFIAYSKIGATLIGSLIVAKYISKRFIEYGNSGGIFFAVPILPYGLSNHILKILKPISQILQ